MVHIPCMDEREVSPSVPDSIGGKEELSEAVVSVYLTLNIDVFGKPTTLGDWIDADDRKGIQPISSRLVYPVTHIWDVMTAEAVRIYQSEAGE